MRRIISILLVCIYCSTSFAQLGLSKYEYWFDQESYTIGALDGSSSQEHKLSIDTQHLSSGLHSFYYRAQDTDGNWSPLGSWLFMVKELPKNGTIKVVQGEYWIDSLYNQRTAIGVVDNQLSFFYDGSNLSEGLHTFNYRIQDSEGAYSPISSWNFMRVALRDTTITNVASSCEYWIDGDSLHVNKVAMSGNEVTFAVDASSFDHGLHTLSYRVKDVLGNYSPSSTWMFFRNELRDTTIVNKADMCEYWFDNDSTHIMSVPVFDNEVSFSADASSLSDGAHTLGYRIRDVLGNYSVTQNWLFVKNVQMRGKRIAWYKTWWNDHFEKAETVEIDADTTDYVFTQQIEVPDYAKNDDFSRNSTARFNIVFGDDAGNTSRIESFEIVYPDNVPPISTIDVVEQTNEQVSLKWYANEDDIDFYNIYVSENNKPFILWMPNTTATSATFKTKDGVSYRFLVTARDNAGNMEKYDEHKCVTIK